jgi:phosphopantetheinyl transferase (holo-ACP synthase)
MIGNDVVDLKLASQQSNWRRKGFLEKVFSAEEQLLIHNSSNKDRLVWLLWSMKEAAYKAHQRKFQLPKRLSWRDLKCSLNDIFEGSASGLVTQAGQQYFTTSEISENYINTSCQDSAERSVKNVIFETSSEELKKKFLHRLSLQFSVPAKELEIQKNSEGIPMVFHKGQLFYTSFSLSSHGRYAAFSRALMNC